ncbi:hypothetical protein BDV59DRAFT_167533 [Aspergillus ambiguus]|uniref:uncharacterized protein n=1 Tax=Aspergillus ambiguus TaxID=176160 RepID=UPI003CCE3676
MDGVGMIRAVLMQNTWMAFFLPFFFGSDFYDSDSAPKLNGDPFFLIMRVIFFLLLCLLYY